VSLEEGCVRVDECCFVIVMVCLCLGGGWGWGFVVSLVIFGCLTTTASGCLFGTTKHFTFVCCVIRSV